jgi:hypothetical protein
MNEWKKRIGYACMYQCLHNVLFVQCTSCNYFDWPEAEFLDKIPTKVFRVFLLAIHSHLYVQLSLEISIFKLSQPLTVSSVQLLYNVKEKGGKPDRKPYPLPYGLRNLYQRTRKIMPRNLNEINCTFMNSASGSIDKMSRRIGIMNMCH